MSEQEVSKNCAGIRNPISHDAARTEIEAWRGRCLNVFSRAEKSVTESLVKAREADAKIRLEPLAGQRLAALKNLVAEQPATESQNRAMTAALLLWQQHDEKRPFFSHGITTELIDRTGQWHVQIDFIVVQKSACEPRRMILSKTEAIQFEEGLHAAFKAMSNQLGQLRKRVQHVIKHSS